MGTWAKLGLVLMSSLGLAGCGLAINVHYVTEPGGATIQQGGSYLGRSSASRSYYIPKAEADAGVRCVNTGLARADWISGAWVQDYDQVCAPANAKFMYDVTLVLRRPADAPNLGLDLNYANEMAQQALAERQVAAQETAANAEATAAAARLEEARARQEEARTERERLKQGKDK